MNVIRRVGILAHPLRPHTVPVAQRIAASLTARGVSVWSRATWTDGELRQLITTGDGISADTMTRADLVIAIGGDGAMLRASRTCALEGVPLLGVNMGNLGFLTEIESPEAWDAHIDALINGAYWLETRMMVRVEAWRDRDADGGQTGPLLLATYDALNDVVLRSGMPPRMIGLETYIDGGWTTRYNADALIISTPTGSTAYALAAGGPILPPEHRSILIVPVAAHLSLDRPIVLPGGAHVEVIISPDRDGELLLSADGALQCQLQPDDRVVVFASPHVSRFVRLRDHDYFYRSLLDRLEPRVIAPRQRVRGVPPTTD
jgi:NAD+ kinase